MQLRLGPTRLDVTRTPLVVGILNRTRDSLYDSGAHFGLDALLERADQLVAETLDALSGRFDVPLAVDTTRAVVVAEAFGHGAVLGNDMSGFRDPGYQGRAPVTRSASIGHSPRSRLRCGASLKCQTSGSAGSWRSTAWASGTARQLSSA